MSKLILLDFDGVINALSAKPDRSVHDRWIRTDLLGYPILYSPEVIDYLNGITGADVLWLTTYEKNTALFPKALGVNEFGYVKAPADVVDIRYGDWKPAAGLKLVEEYDLTLWIDDDYGINRSVDHPRVTKIRPNSHIGLSKKNLRAIDEFVAG